MLQRRKITATPNECCNIPFLFKTIKLGVPGMPMVQTITVQKLNYFIRSAPSEVPDIEGPQGAKLHMNKPKSSSKRGLGDLNLVPWGCKI